MKELFHINRWHIHTRLIVFFLLLAIVPLTLVGLISFYISYIDVQNKISEFSKNSTNQISENISNYINQYNQKITDIAFSSELQETYPGIVGLNENDPGTILPLLNARTLIEQYFSYNETSNPNISSIAFYPIAIDKPLSAGVELPIGAYRQNSEYIKMKGMKEKILWKSGTDIFERRITNQVLTVMKNVVNRMYGYTEGVLAMTIYEKELEAKYNKSIPRGGFIYIADSDGKIVSSVDKAVIGKIVDVQLLNQLHNVESANGSIVTKLNVNGNLMHITTARIDKSNWYVLQGVPYSYLIKGTMKVLATVSVIMLCCIVISIIISIVLSRTISSPIKKLQKKMKEVESGDLNISIKEQYYDEFGDLVNGFNNMLSQIRESMAREKKADMERAEAQFLALQAQINPHFLYNTLDTVNWMANMSHADDIALTITFLAKILRFSLDKSSNMTTVRNEIDNLDNYIKIQQQRYNNLLNISVSIDEDIMDLRIIKFLLQPILENSLYHAFEEISADCRIDISGRREGRSIIFEIKDNGIGMDEDAIRNCRIQSDNTQRSGYALWNIIQRIDICYGKEGKLIIESQPGIGTSVRIVIPAEIKEEV